VTNSKSRLAPASLIGVVGGLVSSLAYPGNSIWIAIFLSIGLILFAISMVKPGQAILVGFVSGVAFYASQIPWMTVYLGPVPWLALSVLEGLVFAAGSWALALAFKAMSTWAPSMFATVSKSLVIASLWTAREWVAMTVPYGGFPWSRVSLSQSNSALAPWVFWGGNSLLSFVLVFAAALMLFGYRELAIAQWRKSATAAALLFVVAVPAFTPLDAKAEVGSMDVAAVQGNAKAGLLVYEPLGKILQNHLSASAELLRDQPKPDLVVWPENAADKNPQIYPDAELAISKFVEIVDAPLMFGTITERDEQIFNSSLLWLPKTGQADFYDKKRPVAFGEYVPDRAFWRLLAPDLIDLIPRGYSFGTRDGIFEMANTNVGTMICFEVAVDDISRELVAQGATILIAQTNNSDFGRTNQSDQQLAIAKLRAIETGRAFINISTVGTSAMILPTGEVVEQLETYTADVMRQKLPLRTSQTPAMLIGSTLEMSNNFAALGILIYAIATALRRRRGSAT